MKRNSYSNLPSRCSTDAHVRLHVGQMRRELQSSAHLAVLQGPLHGAQKGAFLQSQLKPSTGQGKLSWERPEARLEGAVGSVGRHWARALHSVGGPAPLQVVRGTHLSSALQGQAVKAAAGVWQDRNWASELDSGLRAVSVLGRLLCARGGPGAAGRQPVARDGERKASRRGLVQTGIPSASLPSH